MPNTWAEAIANRTFLAQLIGWLLGLSLFIGILPHFLNDVLAPKPGILLNDFILNSFTPKDCSSVIFVFIIGAPVLFFVTNFLSPIQVLMSIQCYVVVNFTRMATLYLFTLEAPIGTIPLVDPFLELVAYGGNEVFVKDLFFSGHTSTLLIVFLIEKRKVIKLMFLFSTILVAFLLMWQWVHYTIDIIGAIFVTPVVYLIFLRVNAWVFKKC
jgi:hypothetical protein